MQSDERISAQPMAADAVPPVTRTTLTSACPTRASVNAIPIAPVPTTR